MRLGDFGEIEGPLAEKDYELFHAPTLPRPADSIVSGECCLSLRVSLQRFSSRIPPIRAVARWPFLLPVSYYR